MGRREQHHAQQPQPPPFKDVAEFRQAVWKVEILMKLIRAYIDRIKFERRQRQRGIVPTSTVEPCWGGKFALLAADLSDPLTVLLVELLSTLAQRDSSVVADLFRLFSTKTPTTPPKAA
jgi:hypothetical protein